MKLIRKLLNECADQTGQEIDSFNRLKRLQIYDFQSDNSLYDRLYETENHLCWVINSLFPDFI